MKLSKCLTLAFMLVTASAAQFSCRPAAYEIIKPKKKNDVSQQGGPNSFSPENETPTDTAPKPILTNVLPTARMEVIWNGVSVNKVKVNSPVTVKPSYDTLDPDDIGVSQCVNPGIVKAAYTLDYQNAPVAERINGCETLAVPHTFTRVGEYELTMLVTSNENETAIATMTITVVDENTSLADVDGGLKITADPMVAGKGQVITFTATCSLKKPHTVSWTFGDGTTATGDIVKHSYPTEGQFRVQATCTDDDGKSIDSSITIVVVDKPVTIPGKPVTTIDPTDPTDPGTTDPSNPGDGQPGQQPGQVPGQQPGQTPGQKPGQN